MKYNKDKWRELREVMQAHKEADQLMQGQWWKDGKERAIEKAIEMYDLPPWITYWSERVFEGLPRREAFDWPVQLIDAMIEYEGDFERLRHDLAIKRLSHLLPSRDSKVNSAIQQVIDYHKAPEEEKRIEAALAAARPTTKAIIWSATKAAVWSATELERSAAESAVCSSAEFTAWQRERDWILELMG